MEKLKELHSEQACTHRLGTIQGLQLTFYCAYLFLPLSAHQFIWLLDAFQRKLQTIVPFTLNTQQHVICYSFNISLSFFFGEMYEP